MHPEMLSVIGQQPEAFSSQQLSVARNLQHLVKSEQWKREERRRHQCQEEIKQAR
jgi:hypothetical protein